MIHKITRHKIYKEALRSHRANKISNLGFCSTLTDGVDKHLGILSNIDPYHDMKEFPEITKHRPKRIGEDSYWFQCNDKGWKKREEILLQVIEETKIKEKSK